MRTSHAVGAAALMLGLAAAGPASAQGWGQGWSSRLFDRVDGDGDGRITRAEADSAVGTRFALMDANADGRIAPDEVTGAAQARTDRRLAKRFERLDANGDGAVVRGEFADWTAQRFRRLDADGDGALARDEIERAIRRGGG